MLVFGRITGTVRPVFAYFELGKEELGVELSGRPH
jgi:hypothetical protein